MASLISLTQISPTSFPGNISLFGKCWGFSTQKDHVRIALDDLMRRYTPSVHPSRYRLVFVPVVGGDKTRERDSGIGGLDGSEEDQPAARFTAEERSRGHLLRTAKYCWCDMDVKDKVLQWNPSAPIWIQIPSPASVVRTPQYQDAPLSRTPQ